MTDELQTTPTPPRVGLLRQIRLDVGLSIRQLSEATGLNRGRLSIIERGIQPTDDELRLIMGALYPKRSSRSKGRQK